MLSPDEIRYSIKVMRQTFPEAGTTLIADTNYHFLLATILSAQSTDQSVNEVTPALFARFPLPADLAGVEPAEVEPYIKRLGLYRNKAKFLVKTSQQIVTDFNGEVPHTLKELGSVGKLLTSSSQNALIFLLSQLIPTLVVLPAA